MHHPAPAVQRRHSAAPRGALAALLVALLLAGSLPGSAQTTGTLVVNANAGDTARIDLRNDAGKLIEFVLHEADFPEKTAHSTSMAVHLVRPTGDRLVIALQRDSAGAWRGTLPVDTVDLVTGDYTAAFFAVRSQGGNLVVKQRPVQVTLADAEAPGLSVLPVGDPIRLGPADALEIEVDGEFLRAVTVQHDGLPQALQLAAPYRVMVDAFSEGVHNVTVTASDRAGHVSTSKVKVDRDTLAPILQVSVPEVGYSGVPFAIFANATERSQHSVRLIHNGSAETRTVGASSGSTPGSHAFVVTPPAVGNNTYFVEAVDIVGNRVTSVFTIPIVAPPTDLRAVALSLAPGPAPFVGHPAIVVATLEQVGGVTSLPVTVTFSTPGQQETMTVTLPAAGPKLVEWNVTLPPGPQDVTVRVEGPAFANETNPGNENATATIETYLGSVRVGRDLFLIRADERGLPVAAVEDGATRSYPLKLVQDGRGVQYQFELPGNVTGLWDPLDPIAPEPEEPTSSATSTTGDSKGAAAPGLAMALLVVALAALVQRRR